MNILIIEDEILIQNSLVRYLQKSGHVATGSASGQRAIELILTQNYHKIFCDLMLQDVSGFDVLDTILMNLGANYIQNRFIIMTAYTSSQILKKAEIYNCPIITKPFDSFKIILEQVNIFLDQEAQY